MNASAIASCRPAVRELELAVPRLPEATAYARGELRGLRDELSPGRLGELQLVVSELVTNALVHGSGAIRLEVRARCGQASGSVADDGGGFVYEPRTPGPDEASGRGLQIVAALASDWGVCDGVSVVWFELGRLRALQPARA